MKEFIAMKMKLKLYTLALLVVLFGSTSCENFTSIEPEQNLDIEVAFTTADDIRTALVGAYNRLQDEDLMSGNIILLADLMSNNIIWQGSFTQQQEIQQLQIPSDNGVVLAVYRQTYVLINNANGILENVEAVDGLSAEETQQIRGEALFLRGLAYFEALRYFSIPYNAATAASDPGIPIQLNFIDDATEAIELPRSSVEEVYNQAIADLTQASQLLPDMVGNGLANRFVALAYLAEIALHQGRYQDVINFTSTIIDEGGFALNADVASFYTSEFSGESIMEIATTVQDNSGVNSGLTTFYARARDGGREDIILDPNLTEAFRATINQRQQDAVTAAGVSAVDTRLSVLVEVDTTGGIGSETSFSRKYEDATNNADNPIVFRLAEIFLMKAEAHARLSQTTEALADLNTVRARAIVVTDGAGEPAAADPILYTAADFASDAELADLIIAEKRVELAFEGSRFHDLRRLGLPVRGLAPNSTNIVFPIPQSALDNNSLLTQNPGY